MPWPSFGTNFNNQLVLLDVQDKLQARLQVLRPLASGCSDRELAILASAVEEISQTRHMDPMKDTVVIQVEPRILIAHPSNLRNSYDQKRSFERKRQLAACKDQGKLQINQVPQYLKSYSLSATSQDQNFGRSNFCRSDLATTTCLIPGGKYLATGKFNFRQLTAKETGVGELHDEVWSWYVSWSIRFWYVLPITTGGL